MKNILRLVKVFNGNRSTQFYYGCKTYNGKITEEEKTKAPTIRGLICGWVSKYREIKFPTQYY
jgi:hypothetical protein